MSKNKKKPSQRNPAPSPSTGEGADSAMEALKKKRGERPADPPAPPPHK